MKKTCLLTTPVRRINRRQFLKIAASATLIPAIRAGGQKASAKPMKMVSMDHGHVVDENGREMLLRGINAGSWFMIEPWICGIGLTLKDHLRQLARECEVEGALREAFLRVGPFDDDTMLLPEYLDRIARAVEQNASGDGPGKFREQLRREPPVLDAVSLDRLLRERFGGSGADSFWAALHECWITPDDLRAARDAGFNFIRLPFWYRWVESEDARGVCSESGLRLLASAVAMAAEAGMYVLLDLHGAPGGQSMWDHTGEMGRNAFFATQDYQERAARLWRGIAERFRNEPAVLGYDLLNEPAGAPDISTWGKAHDGMYRAIRAVDADRLIVMEDGYKTEEPRYFLKGWFPRPEDMGWRNVMYSLHFYKTGTFEIHVRQARLVTRLADRERRRCGVPIYIGEFNAIEDSPDGLRAMTHYGKTFSVSGLHWSPWTLKYCGEDAASTLWGLRRCREPWEPLNPHRDSLDALMEGVRRYADGRYFHTHEPYAAAIRSAMETSR